ncbi:MAG: Gfo/Idh/MocA family oxidoreductase [Bacteroidota bacterium]
MLKIGVFGVGHLGKIHLNCLKMLPEQYELVGFFDPDTVLAQKVSSDFGVTAFNSEKALLERIDIADIVAPTSVHFELAQRALKAEKHIFIEKPLTYNLEEAEALMQSAAQATVKIQVGHVERFNPALLALGERVLKPMFIEGHRLALFNPRGTDVSVILDLMIHDLDILLHLIDAPITKVSASGVAVVSDNIDIANARIEFENGCVANLTASRISIKQMRKMRLFQPDAYVSLDFLEKKAQIIQLDEKESTHAFLSIPTEAGKKWITLEEPTIEPSNAIKMELSSFARSIQEDLPPKVSIKDGYKALHLAHQIVKDIQERQERAFAYSN